MKRPIRNRVRKHADMPVFQMVFLVLAFVILAIAKSCGFA